MRNPLPLAFRTLIAISALLLAVQPAAAQPFNDPCFTSPNVGTSFAGTANVVSNNADLLQWNGSAWTGYWAMANITIPPPGGTPGTRAIWSGDGTVWTTGGEGFRLRLTTALVSNTTYTFAFRRVSHGYGQNGTFAPIMYTNTGSFGGTSYGAIPGVGTSWTTTNISFTASAASNGHTWIYFHNQTGSGMFLGCTVPILPMAFSNLQAYPVGEAIHLEWQVQDEANYSWHVVERSTNGFDFAEVGREPSVRAGALAHQYGYVDEVEGIAAGTPLYYRIRSIDQEGLEALSPVVTAQLGARGEFHVRIVPNPIQQGETTEAIYYADGDGNVPYSIYDMNGRLMLQGNGEAMAGRNVMELPTQGLAAGVYLLRMTCGGKQATEQILIQ
jgi:hypothetical protein